jgi:hypothetical protein
MAKLRTSKQHTTIKYLERDFAELFVWALSGLGSHGEPDATFRGREWARNAAMARFVVSSGLRCQESTEIPDPREAQIKRLKVQAEAQRARIAALKAQLAELTAFKTLAISRLAAQYEEILRPRQSVCEQSRRRFGCWDWPTVSSRGASRRRCARYGRVSDLWQARNCSIASSRTVKRLLRALSLLDETAE